jgi:Lower baseplate protein N-terminal domain
MRRSFSMNHAVNLAVNHKLFPTATGVAISLAFVLAMGLTFPTTLEAQGPALTTISDTIYRADGTPALGTVLISWPTFQTAEGDAVAAGNLAVTIGPLGAFVAQLVPNVGASPAGTYYVVVFQLDDGTVRSEYWAVPATSPTTIAAILTTPGTGLGNLAVTEAYVDAAIAPLAVNSTVVHLAGSETITGTKQFTVPPSLPAPAAASDAANKGYVDTAVGNVGSGAYVPLAGGTMTGPLTLPTDPSAPNQAADRHYVDGGLAVKADLVNGTVPSGELGAGVASSATCLNGNSTWGTCGGGAPAGITYATTALNWTQTISSGLTGNVQATVTLTPCPVGVDTVSGYGYQVLVSGSGNSEAVNVVSGAGGCTSGGSSGTIKFTPFNSYPAGYTISSASSGIQETINAGCGINTLAYKNSQCNVTIPANGPFSAINTYNVQGTIYLHSNQSILSGYGTTLSCLGRGPCLEIGDLVNSNDFTDNTVAGLSFRSPVNLAGSPAFAGDAITHTQRASQVATITTAYPHGFRVGDLVTIMFTDSSGFWGDAAITAVPSPTTFQYAHPGPDLAAQATPGVVALAYVAVLDNAQNSHFTDISYDAVNESGQFNNFFDLWDDENVTIDHFNNQAISLNNNLNWTGSFVFSAGNQTAQIAPVITLRDSTITANASNGVTAYNSNGVYIENTVLQATGPWEVYSSNTTGNYQGAYLKNIYSESNVGLNPLSPQRSPFPGLGIAGLIAGASSGASHFQIAGSGGMNGGFAVGGTGTTPYSYFIVANDVTAGTQTSPMQVLNWSSTGNDSIPVLWPRVANGNDVITYDVIRMASPGGVASVYPYNGGCTGGSGGACGYVATGLTQSAACSGGLVCTYTDNGSASTTAYTIQQATYGGNLVFWPGSVVTVNRSVTVDTEQSNVVGVGLYGNPLQIAQQCSNYGTASPGGYTTCLASVTNGPGNGGANQSATILTDGTAVGGGQNLTKGRLNFSTTGVATLNAHHIITLIDSQPNLTQSTWGYRALASANDTWIGTDLPPSGAGLNAGQLAFGAPVSITNYIAQTGDGVNANWLERLSASLKEFNVPVKFDQSVTLAGLTDGCLNIASGVLGSTGSPCGTGGGGGNVTSVFGRTGAVVATTGDYTAAQVTGAAVDATVVHLANNETVTGAKTFTSTVTASSNLLLPQGNGFVPAVGGIGLDTTAGLPVVNLAGTTHQVAFTSSNISGQAGTALALAAVPTQCSGAFATGIAANGNANCTTPNVIQLSETTPPAGIPNWGVFWFDSATHTPRVIENNGQVMQLGLSNLFNTDPGGDAADNLEERNGTNAESLRVYSSFTNNTTWQRTSLGFDATDGYAVVRSENATSASAPGLGLWVGSGLKWVVDATGNLKPWTQNAFNVGSDSGNAAKSIFAQTSFNSIVFGRNDFEIPNDTTTGTVVNQLAVFNTSSPSGAVVSGMSPSNGVIGVVQGNAGKTGNAVVTWRGYAYCSFDSAVTAGDAVIASTSVAGDCHDTGSGALPSSQLIGYVDITNTVSGQTNGMRVSLQPAPGSGGGGSVSAVFGRTGAVTASSGDYSVAQVTGAAVDANVVHLAGTETITGTKTFSSTVTFSGNLNVAGSINQTGTGPTQWSGQEWTGTSVTVPSGTAFSIGVGSDNTFRCQLLSGTSCMPVASVFGRTGAVVAASGDYSVGQVTGAAPLASPTFTGTPTVPGYVATSTTVNGHALSSNVTVAASDITTGTLPTAQLPAPACSWITVPTQGGSGNAFAGTNKAIVWGVYNPYPCVTNNVAYVVGTADNTADNYALGLYSGTSGGTGTLIATTAATAGTTFASATGIKHIAWSATNVTVPAGRVYIALTSNCTSTCAALLGTSGSGVTWAANVQVSVTTGGAALPSTVTLPADSFSSGASIPALIVY